MWDTLGSISGLVKPKTLKLIFATSLGARNAALFSHFMYEFHISIPKSSNQNTILYWLQSFDWLFFKFYDHKDWRTCL